MENMLTADQRVASDDCLEDLARAYNDAGRVEECWFMRGVSDALAGNDAEPPDEPAYRRCYRAGYDGIIVARRTVGLL